MRRFLLVILVGYALLPVVAFPFLGGSATDVRLLNVSYDPTRGLWADINRAFRVHEPGVDIRMSHGGSGSQARAVVDGLSADVVTLALYSDTDAIRANSKRAGLLPEGWQDRLPNGSLPYTSTIVFVVRKGNPLGIAGWGDLLEKTHPDGKPVQIITPNPKSSGNGKLVFLAAWGAVRERGGSEEEAEAFVTRMYERRRTPVLESSARTATVTFAFKGIGDVHLTWENEAYLEVEESGGELEVVYPPISLRAEPPVAWVDGNVGPPGTPRRELAEKYLRFLYEPEAQAIIAKHHYRPNNPPLKGEALRAAFPQQPEAFRTFSVSLIDPAGWAGAEKRFFAKDAVFDRIIARQL